MQSGSHHSPETIKTLRNQRIGIHHNHKTSNGGGWRLSKEVRQKLRERQLKRKERLGYVNSPETRKKISKAIIKLGWKGKSHPSFGRKATERQREKMSISQKKRFENPENHPQWRGGISRNKHSLSNPKYKQWRSDVFMRDNWTCQTCGIRGIYLEPHHIKGWAKYPELRFIIDNGITLCRECHKLTDNYKNKK